MGYTSTINFKNRDTLEEFTKLVPLMCEINDKEEVLAEHLALNGINNKHLDVALIKLEDNYYFCNAKDMVAELKKYTDDDMFICPYCLQDMYVVQGYTRSEGISVKAHLKHYANNTINKDCIFNKNRESEAIKEKIYSGETLLHKALKHEIYLKAKRGELEFKIPVDYKIVIDEENFKCKVEFEYLFFKVIDVEKEVQVLKKDEFTSGYRPDLQMILENGEKLFCEITYQSGKTVNDYYDIWKRLNTTTIEARKSDNFIDVEYNCEFDEGEIYVYDDINFRYLYNEVSDKARLSKIKMMQFLGDKEKEYIKQKEEQRIKYIEEKKMQAKKEAEENERKRKERYEANLKDLRDHREKAEKEIKEKNKADKLVKKKITKEEAQKLKEEICGSKECIYFTTCLIDNIEKLNFCKGKLLK